MDAIRIRRHKSVASLMPSVVRKRPTRMPRCVGLAKEDVRVNACQYSLAGDGPKAGSRPQVERALAPPQASWTPPPRQRVIIAEAFDRSRKDGRPTGRSAERVTIMRARRDDWLWVRGSSSQDQAAQGEPCARVSHRISGGSEPHSVVLSCSAFHDFTDGGGGFFGQLEVVTSTGRSAQNAFGDF